MTKINAYMPGFDEKSTLARQTEAANQRDSWLRQMELAQLADMGKAGAAQGPAPVHAKPSASPMRLMPQARENGGQHNAAPLHRSESDATPRNNSASAGKPGPAELQQKEDSSEHPDKQADEAESSGIADVVQGGGEIQLQAPAALASATVSTGSAISAFAAAATAAISAARNSNAASTLLLANDLSNLLPGGVREAARPNLGGSATGDIAEEGEAQEEQAPKHAAPGAEAQLAEKPSWQKRMMHLTGKGQDVDVWIRDGELGPSNSTNLIYRIAGDMASIGLRLKGATINGKPALRAAGALPLVSIQSFAQAVETPQAPQAPQAPLAPITHTGEEHGTR